MSMQPAPSATADATRTVWALYVGRFNGEPNYAARPFEVVWIGDATTLAPSGKCSLCVQLSHRGPCPGMERHLQTAQWHYSECHGALVSLAQFDVDVDQAAPQWAAIQIENQLREAVDGGLLCPEPAGFDEALAARLRRELTSASPA